jgi:hypothetical protein
MDAKRRTILKWILEKYAMDVLADSIDFMMTVNEELLGFIREINLSYIIINCS